jgi:putative two-component system response regulator
LTPDDYNQITMPVQGIRRVVSTFRIVVAARDTMTRRLVSALAPFGYDIDIIPSPQEALESIQADPPDMLIAGQATPGGSALALLRGVRMNRGTEELPVMVIAEEHDAADELRAFQAGTDDYIEPGTTDVALRAKVRVLLRLSAYRRRLQNEKRMLSIKVAERTRELLEITIATVAALEKATAMSDEETGKHMLRVADYSACIAEQLGLGSETVEKIRLYAPLHDVGKVGVPHEILKKEGTLTYAEFEEMKRHTVFGYELLTAARADDIARNIALSHHERMDGTGYPYGLCGAALPMEARVVAVADVFDALTTKRRYKPAMPADTAVRSITRDLIGKFDPVVVEAFMARNADMMRIYESYR